MQNPPRTDNYWLGAIPNAEVLSTARPIIDATANGFAVGAARRGEIRS